MRRRRRRRLLFFGVAEQGQQDVVVFAAVEFDAAGYVVQAAQADDGVDVSVRSGRQQRRRSREVGPRRMPHQNQR
jgi:hypothetical protein